MARSIVPVSPKSHAGARWRRPTSLAFAAERGVVPVSAGEVAAAALEFPVAFVQEGNGYALVAVLGTRPDRNAFVTADGRWCGRYVPAALRTHPFELGITEQGQHLLCIDEGSPWVAAAGDGEPILQADGTPTAAVRQVMEFLTKLQHDRATAAAAVAALHAARVIEPWPLVMHHGADHTSIEGLFRINEAALGALADAEFLKLRQHGALAVAYAQLLSMRNLQQIARLSDGAAATPNQVVSGPELNLSWL